MVTSAAEFCDHFVHPARGVTASTTYTDSTAPLRQFGRTIAQFEALARVRNFEPRTLSSLAEGLAVSGGAAVRMLVRLAAERLISREQEWHQVSHSRCRRLDLNPLRSRSPMPCGGTAMNRASARQ